MRDRRVVADRDRRPLDERRRRSRARAPARVVPLSERSPTSRPARRDALERVRDRRQSGERIAERAKLARRAAARRRLGRQAFDVAHVVERVAHRVARDRIGDERRHGIESRVDRRALRERREHPLPKQARAHRRPRAIEHREQRALHTAAAQRFDQLEVAARHLVERHHAARAARRSVARAAAARSAAARAGSEAARPPRRR